MGKLRYTPIYRALHRPNLLFGGDREASLFLAFLTGGLAVCAHNLVTTIICLVVWFIGIYFLRLAAKADPKLKSVYIRHLKYRDYYPAKSRIFRKS